ncbi:MAG: hypothetical protein QUS07_07370 [Methanothrix sp.]|nr:hypothetical protein [Methanothrix sp.]
MTSDSHKEYVKLLDENPNLAPELWSWHTPGTARKSPADWWDYADGFLMMSGPLTVDEASALKEVQNSGVQLGMSHGFFAFSRDEAQGLIKEYYSFEVSDLPVRFAANPWTGLQTISQEVKEMGFSPDKRKYLVTLLGEDQVKKLEDSTKEMAQNLEALNIDSKEASTQEPTPPAVDTKVLAEMISKSLDLPKVVKEAVAPVVESVSSLDTQLKEVVGRIEKLEKSDDEKLAALIAPATSAVTTSTPASKSKDNVVKDDDPLLTQKSNTSWVNEAFRPSTPAAS